MKLMKWLLGGLVALAVLIIAAVIMLPKVIDPNDYRDQVSEVVRKQTGRALSINGDLSLSVFPWLGVRTEQVTLSQPNHLSDKFGGGNMLEVAETNVRIKALPLLKSLTSDKYDIQVATIVLKQPKVHIITTKKGLTSLDGLSGDDNGTKPPQQSQSDDKQTAAAAGVALVVQGVDLQGGNLIWEDRQVDQRYEVKGLTLTTGNLLGKELSTLSLSGELLDSSNPDIASFNLDGKVRLDVNSLKLVAKNLKVAVERGDFEANVNLGDVDFIHNGFVTLNNLNAKVNLASDDLGPANMQALIPSLSFDQSSGDLLLSKIVANGAYQQRPVNFEGTALHFNQQTQRLAIKQLNMVSDDINASLDNLVGTTMMESPKLSGDLLVKPFNAQNLMKSFAIDYEPQQTNALRKVSFSSSFIADMDSVSLERLRASVDDSELVGSLAVKNFAQPAATFDLQLNEINLDSYSPKESGGEESQNDAEIDTTALAVPMALFKEYKANGQLNVGKLIAGGVQVQDISVGVVSKQSATTITPAATLYSGQLSGTINYQETSTGAKLSVNNTIDSVDLEGLLTDAGVTDQLSGTGNLNMDIEVAEAQGQQTNKGTIKLSALNGALKGIDIKDILDKALVRYKEYRGKETATEEEQTGSVDDQTRFAEMGGTFKLNNFVLTNNDFAMKAPLFRVNGAGEIDMGVQGLDYNVDVAVVKSTDGQGGAGLDELEGVVIPVKIFGPFSALQYQPDYVEILKSAAKNELKKKLGIEGEGKEKLSTKEILKRALDKKREEKALEKQSEGTASSETQDRELSDEEKKDQVKDELKNKLLDKLFK